MKKVLLVLVCLVVTGCGQLKREVAKVTGKPSEYCHEGVAYLQFPSGATVKYDTSGRVARCRG